MAGRKLYSEKPYKTALICGRFQPLHSGHISIIRSALRNAEQVWVYIGSADKSRTEKNPFTFAERVDMLEETFDWEIARGMLKILPLNDREHPSDDYGWGEYLLEHCKTDFGDAPELIVTGSDSVREKWFSPDLARQFDEIVVSREKIKVSATEIRKAILEDNFEFYKQYTEFEEADTKYFYRKLRKILEEVQNEKQAH